MSCRLDDNFSRGERLSVKKMAEKINRTIDSGLQLQNEEILLDRRIDYPIQTLVMGSERCGTKLQVCQKGLVSVESVSNGHHHDLRIEDSSDGANRSATETPKRFPDCLASRRIIYEKVPKIEVEGENGNGAEVCHPSANRDSISVHQNFDGAFQLSAFRADSRNGVLSDYFESSQQKHQASSKPEELSPSSDHSKYYKDKSRNFLSTLFHGSLERTEALKRESSVTEETQVRNQLNSDSKSDCDSIYGSSESLLTTDSIDHILYTCEKIRDRIQIEASSLFSYDEDQSVDGSPNEPPNPKGAGGDSCTRISGCYRARLAFVNDGHSSVTEAEREIESFTKTNLTQSVNDANKMEKRVSPFHFNQRRSLRTRPLLRSYGSVSRIPTTATTEDSPKIQVRHKPNIPPSLTLGRRNLKKSLSDPCEIADDRIAYSPPGDNLKSEINTIVSKVDFPNFNFDNEILDKESYESKKTYERRPLLASIEKLGLKSEIVNMDAGKQCENKDWKELKIQKLRELSEKLKTHETNRPKGLQRSLSITPACDQIEDDSNDFIRNRSLSLPRPHKFARSASYAETASHLNENSDGNCDSASSLANSTSSRKENRYLTLRGPNISPGKKLNLDSMNSLPTAINIKNDLLNRMSDLSMDSAVGSIVSDEGIGTENEMTLPSGKLPYMAENDDKEISNYRNGTTVTSRSPTTPTSQESGPTSLAEKRKRRKGMVFNTNNDFSFDAGHIEALKSNSNGRSLTFPPQRKGSVSEEPEFTSVDSNGLKSFNTSNESDMLQVSELSLADSHIFPNESTQESYHDAMVSIAKQSMRPNKSGVKPLKKKHFSDPSGEKCGNIKIGVCDGSQSNDELSLPDIMLTSKSEPELMNASKSKRSTDLKLRINDSSLKTHNQGGSQPNSPPVLAYDSNLFKKSNTIGPMTAPIRLDDGHNFDNKFCSLSKSPQQSRRYSKKRLRGPYGEMLEEEMRKSGVKHQHKITEDLSFLQNLVECPQQGGIEEGVQRRRICSSIPESGIPPPSRTVDDINLQRSHSDTGTTPKRKISTNIPPLPEAMSDTVMFIEPPQLSPSISVPNFVSDCSSLCVSDVSGAEDNDNLDSFLDKYQDTRTHVVGELYDTEKSYVESLQILVKRYFRSLKSAENAHLVEAHLVEEMFYRVPEILVHHEAFLEVLTQRLANWDNKQKIGDLFVEAFTKQPVIDTYTAFINNWKSAKEAIKSASSAKPAFAKFLEHMSREHKGKLTLDALLIMPVQRIPRYELLIKELLKHTQLDHPDHHPLVLAQKEVHDLALKINRMEREAQEAEQMLQKLRDLETLIEGAMDLAQPDRSFIRHDYVTMAGGLGTKKERCIFLFSDILIITSIKRKTGTIRKTSSITHSPLVSSTLEMNKYKVLMRFSLEDLEITKYSDSGITKAFKEIENLEADISLLGQISDTSNSLNIPHQNLDEVLRDLLSLANKQLTEKHSSDSLLLSLEFSVTTQEGIESLTLMFSTPDRRSTFETDFDKMKQKLASTTEKRSPPEFLYPLPIRKTRSGLEFTCVAGTIGLNSHDLKDVWICNSDGYIGQVCILSLQPEPTVTSCNGVCNSRILCIASIPATNSMSRIDSYTYRRRSTVTDKIISNINVPDTDDNDDIESRSINGNLQLDSDTSEEEEDDDVESQDEDTIKIDEVVTKDGNHQPTMWLGTEDGYIHIYNCQDNIRIKKNKFKMQHSAAITYIIHLDNRVFVSLGNGDLAVYTREKGGGWNTYDPQILPVGSQNSPVIKMLAVAGRLWCGCQNNIIVVNTSTLELEETFNVVPDNNKKVLCMVTSGLGVWVSIENSATIKLFHALSYECICDVNVAPTVTKILSGCDDIIKQHKAACLRVISLLTCKDLLWVGTSAGVVLTLPLPHLTPTSSKLSTLPSITGIPHGHTGHVRFLTCVEMTPGCESNLKNNFGGGKSRYTRRSTKSKELFTSRRQSTCSIITSKLLVISGGYGYEDFRNTSTTEVSGREDSTNHLLLWQA